MPAYKAMESNKSEVIGFYVVPEGRGFVVMLKYKTTDGVCFWPFTGAGWKPIKYQQPKEEVANVIRSFFPKAVQLTA